MGPAGTGVEKPGKGGGSDPRNEIQVTGYAGMICWPAFHPRARARTRRNLCSRARISPIVRPTRRGVCLRGYARLRAPRRCEGRQSLSLTESRRTLLPHTRAEAWRGRGARAGALRAATPMLKMTRTGRRLRLLLRAEARLPGSRDTARSSVADPSRGSERGPTRVECGRRRSCAQCTHARTHTHALALFHRCKGRIYASRIIGPWPSHARTLAHCRPAQASGPPTSPTHRVSKSAATRRAGAARRWGAVSWC